MGVGRVRGTGAGRSWGAATRLEAGGGGGATAGGDEWLGLANAAPHIRQDAFFSVCSKPHRGHCMSRPQVAASLVAARRGTANKAVAPAL